MNFALKAPCDQCPFKRGPLVKGGPVRLEPARTKSLAESFLQEGGGTFFTCHKTVYDKKTVEALREQAHCAGALVFAKKHGVQTQPMQLATRLGLLDPNALQGDSEVFDSVTEMCDNALKF